MDNLIIVEQIKWWKFMIELPPCSSSPKQCCGEESKLFFDIEGIVKRFILCRSTCITLSLLIYSLTQSDFAHSTLSSKANPACHVKQATAHSAYYYCDSAASKKLESTNNSCSKSSHFDALKCWYSKLTAVNVSTTRTSSPLARFNYSLLVQNWLP